MGSGCIIENHDGRILALIDREGKFDLPKGKEDDKDRNPFQTAQRETWEECGIWVKPNDVTDFFTLTKLTLFVIEWRGQKPTITPNPETGEIEHQGWEWVTPEVFMSNCLGYLKPYVREYILYHQT